MIEAESSESVRIDGTEGERVTHNQLHLRP